MGCNLFPVKATKPKICENERRPDGTETLPRGVVSKTTDFEMRPLWGPPQKKLKSPMNLVAIAVGIKQKQNVNNIVKKFPLTDFAIMLFHYDGNVDGWGDLEWSNSVIMWFAKRFLHPDVVARYLSIFKEEGLEISQPAMDADKSEVHYKLTAREISSKVHRRAINLCGPGRRCYENSMEPPCTGTHEAWIFSLDIVHRFARFYEVLSFGSVFFEIMYKIVKYISCQENRTKHIGIVDSEYVIHLGDVYIGAI
ncbi:hypothetical protein PHJA_001262400 [Phtheirospermum japonicum]|uniref:Uncharacterized protein n=1 Tax=Phtheirospermum japonicum TaxID=374723 RepID=A0A830C4I4_9LAMI|nr:hypothetical protein PHJA_001262400 [Phtheirospermum japonicum]